MPTNKELELKISKLEESFKKLNMKVVGLTGRTKKLETIPVINVEETTKEVAELPTGTHMTPEDILNLIVNNAQRNYHKVMKELIPALLDKYNLTLDDFGVRKVPIIPQSAVTLVPTEKDTRSEEPIIKEETH